MKLQNSQGKIFYGMHFYPGVAEYQGDGGKEPYRVFLNEDTLRSMDPTFQGRPIFVEHVDEVEENIDELRKEADGWVIESFYNAADGKHWVKFIVTSQRGERAINSGMRLSNAYVPKSRGQGGLWNGVAYAFEITSGEFDHLAIVRNPRYEESVIMTPDEFKAHNEGKQLELKRLANSKDKKENESMKLNLFKRAKVENSADLESVCVVLPKSKKEMTIAEVCEAHDNLVVNMDGYANNDHMVKLHDGSEMKVSELVDKHKAMNDEVTAMKAAKNAEESESDVETDKASVDSESDVKNAEEEEKKAKAEKEESDKKKNEADDKAKAEKAKADKEKADKLRNANLKNAREESNVTAVEFSTDQVARGKSRYGS